MPRERTFIMIKPDGVQRGLVSKIIARFEEKGFKLVSGQGDSGMAPCCCEDVEQIMFSPVISDAC